MILFIAQHRIQYFQQGIRRQASGQVKPCQQALPALRTVYTARETILIQVCLGNAACRTVCLIKQNAGLLEALQNHFLGNSLHTELAFF